MTHVCRHERILSDVVADHGRPVRMRYCSNDAYAEREEDLHQSLDMHEALILIKGTRAQQHAGRISSNVGRLECSSGCSGLPACGNHLIDNVAHNSGIGYTCLQHS